MTKPNQGYAFRYGPAAARMERILALLSKPHTRQELAEATHIGVRGVQSYLTALMAEKPRRIHVHDWRPNSPGSPTAVYLLGDKRDKKKPRAMTAAERSRRRRADADVAIDHILRQRLERTKPRRDPLTAAMFGPAPCQDQTQAAQLC